MCRVLMYTDSPTECCCFRQMCNTCETVDLTALTGRQEGEERLPVACKEQGRGPLFRGGSHGVMDLTVDEMQKQLSRAADDEQREAEGLLCVAVRAPWC